MLFTTSFKERLKLFEGLCYHLYLDTGGAMTVGHGHMMKHVGLAKTLPFHTAVARSEAGRSIFSFMQMDSPDEPVSPFLKVKAKGASPIEIAQDWDEVAKQPFGMTYGAEYYAPFTRCWLTLAEVQSTFDQDLRLHAIEIRTNVFADFDLLPQAAQEAIFDMEFNMGSESLNKFTHFKEAVNARDWDRAAETCHRITLDESRNTWTRRTLERLAAETRATESYLLNQELKRAHRGAY
jgi:GH24 family phage-related lysozyme (muramidase)